MRLGHESATNRLTPLDGNRKLLFSSGRSRARIQKTLRGVQVVPLRNPLLGAGFRRRATLKEMQLGRSRGSFA